MAFKRVRLESKTLPMRALGHIAHRHRASTREPAPGEERPTDIMDETAHDDGVEERERPFAAAIPAP